jgi:diacylglycerol kinase family enzyme
LPVIISAAAGGGRASRHEAAIRAALDRGAALEFRYPASLDALRDAVAGEIRLGTPLVAVGGGDGTLHHAANAIGDAPITLAPLPIGTGNDFCRSLGLGPPLGPALEAIRGGRTRVVDLLDVNGVRVLTVAGLGVVSASALQVGRLSRRGHVARPIVRAFGSLAYLGAAGARLLLQPRLARHAVVRWRAHGGAEWQQVDGRYYGIFLACRPALGAGLRLPLDVPPDDGRFEIVLVERSPRVTVALQLPKLRSGRHVPPNILSIHQAEEASIEWPDGTAIVGDGEDLGSAVTVGVRVLPKALRVTDGR